MLTISAGYSPWYLLKEVATGRENYYTGAVAEGEPPGRWWGGGAAKLGLSGLVDAQDMMALYERFLDPRQDGFRDPARWDELDTLGHAGRKYLSEEQLYAHALQGEPDAGAERRAELRAQAGRDARQNVAFFDATFSVAKSVTLTHAAFEAREIAAHQTGDEQTAAAWGQFRQAVEDAIWAGNRAGLEYLAANAGYTRVGHHGGAGGRWADAHDWVVGSFFQHDSRDLDPQLHIHNTILNRVEGPDWMWRTLDSRGLYRVKPAAAAIAERVTEERIAHALGVLSALRPDGKAREIVGVAAEAVELTSNRRRAVTAKAQELIDAFEQRYGRAPNALQRDRLAQEATLVTRRAKSHHGETRAQLLERVEHTLRGELDGGWAAIADAVLGARGDQAPTPQTWRLDEVRALAFEKVGQQKAGWTRADLIRAINNALPKYLGLPEGRQVTALLDSLADQFLKDAVPLDTTAPGHAQQPAQLRLRNGESALVAPGSQLYATPEQLRSEHVILAAAHHRDAAALPTAAARRFLHQLGAEGIKLGADQAAAVRGILTSGARVETLVGPAGTGKSLVVGMLARAWSDPTLTEGAGQRVFGLATSQIATEVLTGEGLTARNIAAWLATQHRLDRSTHSTTAGEDEAWRLRRGDLVVVDESAMTDTAALAAIHGRVERAGAKLLLVGDPRQLGAVGAGGGMQLIADTGARYQLAETRRFTQDWEGPASLRLRDGDPDVLAIYHRHGRVLDGGTREQAETSAAAAWLGDTLAGRRSLLIVDTNEQAAQVSAQVRAELVRLGLVEEHGVRLGLQNTFAGVGDLVEARTLAWHLAGYEGNRRGPVTRETYRVLAVRPDGGLDVAPITASTNPAAGAAVAVDGRAAGWRAGEQLGDRLVLPADYVAQHLALGYAVTVNSVQGATVDTTHTVVSGRTPAESLYVGMSRGRHANTAHVATTTQVEDSAQGSPERHSLHRNALSVVENILTRRDRAGAEGDRSATAIATDSAARAESMATIAELFTLAAHTAATERTSRWLDQLATEGRLTPAQRAQLAGDDGAGTITRVLRRAELAGLDPHQVLRGALLERPLTGARNVANLLYSRIRDTHTGRLGSVTDTWAATIPADVSGEWAGYLAELADQADQRTADLGRQALDQQPGWAIDALGPPPLADQAPAVRADNDRAAAADGDPVQHEQARQERAGRESQRQEWARRAGAMAAYRELRGHDHPTDALPRSRGADQVEAYAAYQAAHRAWGASEQQREEMQMSDGQLLARIRASHNAALWEPPYVANQLAGTRQVAGGYRHTSALRAAEADTATEPGQADRLRQEARDATALAELLDHEAERLQEIDDARTLARQRNATTHANGDSAGTEYTRRHADDPHPAADWTGEDWLAEQHAHQAEEDRDRDITEADIHEHETETADVHGREVRGQQQAGDQAPHQDAPGEDARAVWLETITDTGRPARRRPLDEDTVREATPAETEALLAETRRYLLRMQLDMAADAAREAAERDGPEPDYANNQDDGYDDPGAGYDRGEADDCDGAP